MAKQKLGTVTLTVDIEKEGGVIKLGQPYEVGVKGMTGDLEIVTSYGISESLLEDKIYNYVVETVATRPNRKDK
jgi:hypothetical protein